MVTSHPPTLQGLVPLLNLLLRGKMPRFLFPTLKRSNLSPTLLFSPPPTSANHATREEEITAGAYRVVGGKRYKWEWGEKVLEAWLIRVGGWGKEVWGERQESLRGETFWSGGREERPN